MPKKGLKIIQEPLKPKRRGQPKKVPESQEPLVLKKRGRKPISKLSSIEEGALISSFGEATSKLTKITGRPPGRPRGGRQAGRTGSR